MIWKKKQPLHPIHPQETNHERIKSLEARIAKLEMQPVPQPPIVLYKLDPQEDVLVQCVVGDDRVAVPLSQIITQVEQVMVAKVKANGARSPRSRAKVSEQGGQAND